MHQPVLSRLVVTGRVRLAFAVAVTLLLTSGGAWASSGTVVWQKDADFVRYEPAEGAGSPVPSALPPLSADAVRAVLASIKLSGGDGDQAFLTDSQLAVLAEPVARALRGAAPGQDVAFAAHFVGTFMSYVGPPKATAGRIFVDGDAIGVIVGQVRASYLRNMVTADASLIRTGSRTAPQETEYHVVPGGPVSLAKSDRGDWVRIAPAAWTGTYGMPLAATPPSAPMAASLPAAPAQNEPAAMAASGYQELASDWATAWSAGNIDKVMDLYAAEPVFQSSRGERWSGAAEIRRHFAEALTKNRGDLHMHSIRSGASGALAYDSGSCDETLTPLAGGGAPHALRCTYLFLLQRGADGAWKILEQSWTELSPP